MSEKQKAKEPENLESLTKTAAKCSAVGAIVALDTPIHEGLHALMAEILPGADSLKVVFDSGQWYAPIVKAMDSSYVTVQNLNGYQGLAYSAIEDTVTGQLSSAAISAVPEVATMTLGFYWVSQGVRNMSQKGQRIFSYVQALGGTALLSSAWSYAKSSSFNPSNAHDHYGFTKSIINVVGLPETWSKPLTVVGVTAMAAGSLYCASKIANYVNKGK